MTNKVIIILVITFFSIALLSSCSITMKGPPSKKLWGKGVMMQCDDSSAMPTLDLVVGLAGMGFGYMLIAEGNNSSDSQNHDIDDPDYGYYDSHNHGSGIAVVFGVLMGITGAIYGLSAMHGYSVRKRCKQYKSTFGIFSVNRIIKYFSLFETRRRQSGDGP